MKQGIRRFFKYARTRHEAYHAKMAGVPIGQQSKDPILNEHRFTNVFRELDKTTVWFRKYVRDPMIEKPEVMLATVLFRLLNRIEVGEAIFCQTMLPTGRFKSANRQLTAWDAFLASGDVGILAHAVRAAIPDGPHATGAYIISSPPGYKKLEGVLELVRKFYHESQPVLMMNGPVETNWRTLTNHMLAHQGGYTLQEVWQWLKQFEFFGPFHSYEIVTDLRHTALLSSAPDVMTWANPGPGANRGANRVHGRDKDARTPRDQLIAEMQQLLDHSRDTELWPKAWPRWEMREVEHTLCEFDKYERVRLNEGRPRGVYR